MNEEAMRRALRQCVELKGAEILADKSKLKGILQDLLPGLELQKERNLLIIAGESFSLGQRLLEAPPDGAAREQFSQSLLNEIADSGLSREAAAAVLQSFISALEWNVKISAAENSPQPKQSSAGAAGPCAHGRIDLSGFRCGDCGQTLYGLYGRNGYTSYEDLRKRERGGVLLSLSESCAGALVLPEHITAIADDCLSEQQELEEVVLPASLQSIGRYAFDSCPALKAITVPAQVTSIGEGAFHGLKRVYYDGPAQGSPWGAREHIRGGSPFSPAPQTRLPVQAKASPNAFIAYKANQNFAYNGYGDLKEVVIPDGVSYIGNYAFNNCLNLKSAVIPDSVSFIGEAAFQGCSSLESIVIPDSVASVGQGAFFNCGSLKHVVISRNVASIGQGVFMSCSSLKSVRLPFGITTIGGSAFAHCTGLTDIEIPESVTAIKEYAFIGCSSLLSIKVPDSVAFIGQGAFTDIKRLHYDGPAAGSPWGAQNHIRNGPAAPAPPQPPPFGAYGGRSDPIELIIPDDLTDIGGFS